MANIINLSLDLSQPSDNKVVGNESASGEKEKSSVFSDLMEQHKYQDKSGNSGTKSGNKSHESTHQHKIPTDNSAQPHAVEGENLETKTSQTENVDVTQVNNEELNSDIDLEPSDIEVNRDLTQELIKFEQDNKHPEELLSFLSASGNTSTQLAVNKEVSGDSEIELVKKHSSKVVPELVANKLNSSSSDIIESNKVTENKISTSSESVSNEKVAGAVNHGGNTSDLSVSDKSKIADVNVGGAQNTILVGGESDEKIKSNNKELVETKTEKDRLSVIQNKELGLTKIDQTQSQFKNEQLKEVPNSSAAIRMTANPEKQILAVLPQQKDQIMRKYLDMNSIPGKTPESDQDFKVLTEALTGNTLDEVINVEKIGATIAKEQADKVKIEPNFGHVKSSESIQPTSVTDKNISQSANILNHDIKQVIQSTADFIAQSQKGNEAQVIKQNNNALNVVEQISDDIVIDDVLESDKNVVKGEAKSVVNPLFDTLSQREATAMTQQLNERSQSEQSFENVMSTMSTEVTQTHKHSAVQQAEVISIMRKDFNDAVKEKVMVMINQKIQQVDIQLDPPEFGNMQVRINLQNEQAVVSFIVQNQQAKEALEQNMDKLKHMMADSGVDVGEANVKQQSNQSSSDNNKSQSENNTQSELSDSNIEHQVDHNSLNVFKASSTGVDYYA